MNADGVDYGGNFEEVFLYRQDNSLPWGFRMNGGKDQGSCLYVAKVNPRSRAQKFGLREGDEVVRIGPVPAYGLTHGQAKAEILRAGNELHFIVKRNAVRVPAQAPQKQPERSEVVEEETQYQGKRQSKVQSRSFRIITDCLVDELSALEGSQSGVSTSDSASFTFQSP